MATTSTSTSASAHSNYSYDVFINHRGIDVKKNFASHLYLRLVSYGLRTFLDQPELKRGEKINPQIEGAIASASVHVAIFSPRYAESTWCLDELDLMLKSNGTIIPVFYNVKPSNLRWTERGSDNVYAKALLNYEKKKRYDPAILAAWRKALSDASLISGFELEAFDGDEGVLVENVARQVQKKVGKAPLEVATHPTGLDEKLLGFEKTVLSEQQQQHRGGPNLVGIVGLGGVGKTTLAKLFLNTKGSDYKRSCFLPDVRDAAARRLLPSLQSKLYKDLTGGDQIMDNVDEGMATLKHRLFCSQALIVLDDVDDVEQLGALYSPLKDALASDSLILLTSRNKDVLRKSAGIEESSIYKMTGLNREHSEQLFCSHAFHQPYPAVGYEELVRKFLDACQGLPLSLKVIGALLYSESPEYWEEQLRKLSQVLPKEIQRKLKISYDSLDQQEKEIFLDIACFFIGINRDTAIRIWDGSGWEGSLGVRTLESKCLVTLDLENCIRMHDHLRDLGRDLAEKKPPGCPRRLWRPTDDLFRDEPPQSTVRGISMLQRRSGESFQIPAEFSNRIVDMSRLQLLRAPPDFLESLFKVMRHPELLWLRCEIHYRFSSLPSWIQINDSDFSLPSWIPIKNLRVLELVESYYPTPALLTSYDGYGYGHPIPVLRTLWNTESEAPLQLRELNIGVCLLQLPKSIGQLKYLEKIELHKFTGILPEEFFHLRSLKYLRLTAGVKSLPDSLGNFTNLQHIDLSHCNDLQTLPPSFGNLTKLQHVILVQCLELKMLPDSFKNLIRLKHLDLRGCRELTLSGETLGNISTLEMLSLYDCEKIEILPPQVTHQQSLEELLLEGTQLKELPSAIGDLGNLKNLSLSSPLLETLPHSLGKLAKLKYLTLSFGKLKYFPDLVVELKQLEFLSLASSGICEVPFASVEKVRGGRRLLGSSIDQCMLKLIHLHLSETRITEISFGKGVCPVLRFLDLTCCDNLEEVGALPITLTSLDLRYCCALKKITGLRGLAKLRTLEMTGCYAVEELPGLETLRSLMSLRTSECENMKRIRVMAEAANPESDVLKKVLQFMEAGTFKEGEDWRDVKLRESRLQNGGNEHPFFINRPFSY